MNDGKQHSDHAARVLAALQEVMTKALRPEFTGQVAVVVDVKCGGVTRVKKTVEEQA